jgi:hypothetical protein
MEAADIQLAVIRVKTDRAKQHILQVEDAAKRVNLGGISMGMDSKGNFSGPKPTRTVPIEVITGAGDAIHNLRSALDHLAWQLSHWRTGKPGPRPGFPIGKSFEDYKAMKGRMVAGMSPDAKKAINDLRPYKGGNEPLWTIHHLDIVDKHHQLFVFGYQNLFSGLRLPGTYGTVTDNPAHFLGIFAGDLEGEYNSSGQPPRTNTQISKMQPLIPALHDLLVFTEDLIQSFRPLVTTRKS